MIDPLHISHSSVNQPSSSSLPTDRRRRSVPINAAPALRRRSANHVNVKPASAEVISSLISTLSAISPPLYQHSDRLPEAFCHSTPSSPLPQSADFAFITNSAGDAGERDPAQSTGIRFCMDSEFGETSGELKGKVRPSPIEALDRWSHSNRSKQTSAQDKSRSELSHSSDNGDDGWTDNPSIGHLSIEPPPRLSVVSTISSESAGRKSVRSFKSLNFRSSKDGISEETKSFGDVDVIVFSSSGDESERDLGGAGDTSMTPPLSSALSEQTFATDFHAITPENAYQKPTPRSEAHHGRTISGPGEVRVGSLGPVATSRMVPTRDSSLRSSYPHRAPYQNRKSCQGNLGEDRKSAQQSVEAIEVSRLSISPQNAEVTEDEVSRRIRELKDQKKVRDYSGAMGTVNAIGTLETSELRRTSSPHSEPQVLVNEKLRDLQGTPTSEREENGKKEATESSAPFPAIVQRINRNSSSRVSSIASKSIPARGCSPGKMDEEFQRESATPPKRSNSRMLKRLSRPPSPLSSERHKRTSSNAIVGERPTSTNPVDKAVDSYISSSRLSQKVFHPQTGRTISFSEVGDPNGSAVLCCVGMGLTRYITAFYDELALTLKLRLITPDRPGVGGSESHPDGSETPLGWPGKPRPFFRWP